MDKYRVDIEPKLKNKDRITSWRKIKKHLEKFGSATFDDLVEICRNHRHKEGGKGFIRHCIDSGWLVKTDDERISDMLLHTAKDLMSRQAVKTFTRKTSNASKKTWKKLRPHTERLAKKSEEMLKGSSPAVQKAADKIGKAIDKLEFSRSTKVGGLAGAITGLLLAGTGGMGIVALGGAIGVPVAIVTAAVGAGIGSRVGSVIRSRKKIKVSKSKDLMVGKSMKNTYFRPLLVRRKRYALGRVG
jgi:hypothetical protein